MNSNNSKTLSTDIILIERDVLYAPNIDPFAKCLYCILRYKENHTLKRCELSQESIKIMMNTSSTEQITQAIKSLEEHNYIIVDHSPDGNKYYFRENIDRPITVFVSTITDTTLSHIAKIIYIILYNHYDGYCMTNLVQHIGKSADTIRSNINMLIKHKKTSIDSYKIGNTDYYCVTPCYHYWTNSRQIEIPFDISKLRELDSTPTDMIVSDAAITLYAYLCMYKAATQNFVKFYADYAKKDLGLTLTQLDNSIIKLINYKFIKPISAKTRPLIIEFIKPKSAYMIYSDILLTNKIKEDPRVMDNPKLLIKAISYYIEHCNDTVLPQNAIYDLLKDLGFIKRNRLIDFAGLHKNDRYCDYNVESHIGKEYFNDPCTPVGIASSMLRDAILYNNNTAKSKHKSLYRLVFSNNDDINMESLLYGFINHNYSERVNITKYLYDAYQTPDKYVVTGKNIEPDIINYFTYNNTLKMIIDVHSVLDNVLQASNCHNTSQDNFNVFFDPTKYAIDTGRYIVTLKAVKTPTGFYEYNLVSCMPYTDEKIYGIDHTLSDESAIVFFDKQLMTLKHQMLTMCGTGVALKNTFNLTVPFKCKVTVVKSPGHLYTIDRRLALKIKLIGEYYNLVDGLNVYCDYYQIHIGCQKDFNVLMSTIKMDKAHIDAISSYWDKIVTDGVINITNLTTALKTKISDKNTIDKYISTLEMIRPIALLTKLSEIDLFKDSKLKQSMNTSLCEKVFTTHGLNSLYEIKSNPYTLLLYKSDQLPISFDTIDNYVYSIGIKYNDQIRMDGIITYLVQTFTESGSVGIDISDRRFVEFVNYINKQSLFTTSLTLTDVIDYTDTSTLARIKGSYIVSRKLYDDEINIADNIKRILDALSHIRITDPEIDNFASDNHIIFDAEQVAALKAINNSNVVIIQGSAGTGKSFIIKSIIKIFAQLYPTCEYALVTPTGKAARVYRDVEATTIHRLLGYQSDKGFSECRYTSLNPFSAKLIIIDEASMVDINAAKALLDAVANGSKIVFVGDQNQLLPVEAGQVYRDLIASGKIHTILLNKIYRTESKTIISNSNRVLEGKNTFISDLSFEIILKDNTSQVIAAAQELAHSLYGSYDRLGVQVLTHSKKDTDKINQHIKSKAFIKKSFISLRGYKKYYVGEKIIFTKNDVDNKYVNGQVGIITAVDDDNKTMEITTNNRVTTLKLGYKDLKNIDSAYAITIHKSQGSEYEQVVIALTDNADTLLCRELLYTAITRASKKVTIIATENSLNVALSSTSNRITFLSKIIRDLI